MYRCNNCWSIAPVRSHASSTCVLRPHKTAFPRIPWRMGSNSMFRESVQNRRCNEPVSRAQFAAESRVLRMLNAVDLEACEQQDVFALLPY